MPAILDSEKSSHYIEQIINNSEKTLSLMMPVFRLTDKLFSLLVNAAERNVQTTIMFSSDELDLFDKSRISELPHIDICHCDGLNSRCYFNEKDMIITSIELHNFHEKKSGDISIAISRIKDDTLYKDAKELFNKFYETSVIIISSKDKIRKKTTDSVNLFHGFCIRCAIPISFNLTKPYCRNCMNEIKIKNESSERDNFCHSCAKKTDVNFNQPRCPECSNK